MMRTWWLVVLLGCGGGSDTAIDAAKAIEATKAVDAADVADAHAVDAPLVNVAKASSHVMFLNAEGPTLHYGAMEDATHDVSRLVQTDTTFSPWLAGQADRQTRISSLRDAIAAKLAAYDIAVVVARPASGVYDEIIVTDDPGNTTMAGPAPGLIRVAVACNEAPSSVGIILPSTYSTDAAERERFVGNSAIGMFGFMNGLPEGYMQGDCMCIQQPYCWTVDTPSCPIGGPNTQLLGQPYSCGYDGNTIDEQGAFLAAFGPHP